MLYVQDDKSNRGSIWETKNGIYHGDFRSTFLLQKKNDPNLQFHLKYTFYYGHEDQSDTIFHFSNVNSINIFLMKRFMDWFPTL